jgi:hypothetical protein
MALYTSYITFPQKDDPEVPWHIAGIANAYGIVDAYNEIVEKGACKPFWIDRAPERVLSVIMNPYTSIGKAHLEKC